MSDCDQRAAKMIARSLHKAICDVHSERVLDAGVALGNAEMLTWEVEDIAVKDRAIRLCDAAYRHCVELDIARDG